MRFNCYINVLLICLVVTGTTGILYQQITYLNENVGTICFTIPEGNDYSSGEGSIASIQLKLNVAYTTGEADAGIADVTFNSTSPENQLLRYEHHITNMSHDLKVWLNDEEITFTKTSSPRWYYMSTFMDVVMIADGPINFECSGKNFTAGIFLEEIIQNEPPPSYDYDSLEIIGTPTAIEELNFTNIDNHQFSKNLTINPDAELLPPNYTEYVEMPININKTEVDVTWANSTIEVDATTPIVEEDLTIIPTYLEETTKNYQNSSEIQTSSSEEIITIETIDVVSPQLVYITDFTTPKYTAQEMDVTTTKVEYTTPKIDFTTHEKDVTTSKIDETTIIDIIIPKIDATTLIPDAGSIEMDTTLAEIASVSATESIVVPIKTSSIRYTDVSETSFEKIEVVERIHDEPTSVPTIIESVDAKTTTSYSKNEPQTIRHTIAEDTSQLLETFLEDANDPRTTTIAERVTELFITVNSTNDVITAPSSHFSDDISKTITEMSFSASSARSHSDDNEEENDTGSKPNNTLIYVLAFVLGSLFIAAVIISIVFHQKTKKLNIVLATSVKKERTMNPGETDTFIKLAHGL